MSPSPPLSLSADGNLSGGGGFIFKYCRMCGVQLKQGVFIFGDEGKRLQIPEKIRKTLAILVLEEDTLPKRICTSCCSSLEDYSQYKDVVLDAQKKLAAIAKALEVRFQYEKENWTRTPSPSMTTSTSTLALPPPPPPPTPGHGAGTSSQPSILEQALTSATIFMEDHNDSEQNDGDEVNDPDQGLLDDVVPTAAPEVEELMEEEEQEVTSPLLTIKQLPPPDVKNDNLKVDAEATSSPSSSAEVVVGGLAPSSPLGDVNDGVLEVEGEVGEDPAAAAAPLPPGGFKCPTCDKLYHSKRGLELHVVTHNPKVRFECKACDKGFTQKASLLHHVTSSHSDPSVVRPFPCDSCPKSFLTPKHLRRHRRFHTEPAEASQCSICGKVYKSLLHLQGHMRGHKSKLNFPCSHPGCGKRFQNQSKLSTHSNSHTGERSFKCPHCSYAARSPGPFYRHLKRHEKEKVKDKVAVVVVNSPTINVPHDEEEEVHSVNLSLNFTPPQPQQHNISILEDLSNKSPQKYATSSGGSRNLTPASGSNNSNSNVTLVSISQIHTSPILHQHQHQGSHGQGQHSQLSHSQQSQSQQGGGGEYQCQESSQGQISHAHASSSSSSHLNPQLYHSQNWNNQVTSSKAYQSSTSLMTSTPTSTTTLELVDCSGITHAFPCDQLPPSYHHHQQQQQSLQQQQQYGHNYSSSSSNSHHAHTTAILHTSPSSAHSSSGGGGANSFISTTAPSSISTSSGNGGGNSVTILSGGGHLHLQQQQLQVEPMELSYKLHLEAGDPGQSQDVPMELTKVVFHQRDPLQLCVRDQGQGGGQGSSGGQGQDEFNPLMDLSSARGVGDGGLNLNHSLPLNLNLNNNSINLSGFGAYHCKDLAERELCFNDLSGAFRQPIDLIARGPDDPSHGHDDDLSCSEGSLVDLSLRSSNCFVQDASTSTFLRELIDLSARSESFHNGGGGGNGELNLTNKHHSSTNSSNSTSQGQSQGQSHNHQNHHHHRGGSGGGQGQGGSSSLTSVIYQDAMFSL